MRMCCGRRGGTSVCRRADADIRVRCRNTSALPRLRAGRGRGSVPACMRQASGAFHPPKPDRVPQSGGCHSKRGRGLGPLRGSRPGRTQRFRPDTAAGLPFRKIATPAASCLQSKPRPRPIPRTPSCRGMAQVAQGCATAPRTDRTSARGVSHAPTGRRPPAEASAVAVALPLPMALAPAPTPAARLRLPAERRRWFTIGPSPPRPQEPRMT